MQQQMIPHAEVQIIPQSGHCSFDETPAAFCDILLSWIQKYAIHLAA
jgi:pimeloyl-ACP methyl ester carboxylesterase